MYNRNKTEAYAPNLSSSLRNAENSPFPVPDDVEEVIHLLTTEKGTLNLLVTLAIEYYRRGKRVEFVRLLEVARVDANLSYPYSDEDKVTMLPKLVPLTVK